MGNKGSVEENLHVMDNGYVHMYSDGVICPDEFDFAETLENLCDEYHYQLKGFRDDLDTSENAFIITMPFRDYIILNGKRISPFSLYREPLTIGKYILNINYDLDALKKGARGKRVRRYKKRDGSQHMSESTTPDLLLIVEYSFARPEKESHEASSSASSS